jgi:hypothetical protein
VDSINLLQTASSEASTTTIRLLDYFTIPRANGDSVVLLLVHPGPNQLGHHLPRSKVNDLLLSDVRKAQRSTPRGAAQSSYSVEDIDAPMLPGDTDNVDTMDLATFLECVPMIHQEALLITSTYRFAIQATHCLEILHK